MQQNTDDKIVEMLTLVLERSTKIETQVDAIHNRSLDIWGEVTKHGWAIKDMESVLFGKDKQGGGLVDDVENLKRYGVAISPEFAKRIEATLFLFGVASVCVILMMFIAGLVIILGGLPWR